MDVKQLDELFQEYGYEAKEKNASYQVYVLNQGMYHGAEVVVLDESDVEQTREQYSKLGYHVKEQRFLTIDEAENYLFSGFFNTQTTKSDIEKRYLDYAASQVKPYRNANIKYQYISMPYSVYSQETNNSNQGSIDIVSAIKKEIEKKGARLIIVEAAAGFGKTCTAYEVYKSFAETTSFHKPIFTELSRNRDAKQFKYILWSEIDKEKETTAKQDLVVYNIKNGRIPLIIDGFDELLSKDIDPGKADQLNEFEQVETMLSTIGCFFCHELTQIPTNNLLVESRGIRVSPQKTTNRRASVRFPTIKRKSGIYEICVSPKTPTKWNPCEPKNSHKASVRLWKRGWDFFGEPFGNSQKKAIFVN